MKTDKILEIKVKDPHFEESSYIIPSDDLHLAIDPMHIPNIINHIGEVSEDKLHNAIDTIIVYLAKERFSGVIVDLDYRNECCAPVKEMTIAEIEKELGHKVKIINDDEEE